MCSDRHLAAWVGWSSEMGVLNAVYLLSWRAEGKKKTEERIGKTKLAQKGVDVDGY